MNARVIARLEHSPPGVKTWFRVNLSHTRLEDVEQVAVRFIQDHSRVPVFLDTEGAQVRTTRYGRRHRDRSEREFAGDGSREVGPGRRAQHRALSALCRRRPSPRPT